MVRTWPTNCAANRGECDCVQGGRERRPLHFHPSVLRVPEPPAAMAMEAKGDQMVHEVSSVSRARATASSASTAGGSGRPYSLAGRRRSCASFGWAASAALRAAGGRRPRGQFAVCMLPVLGVAASGARGHNDCCAARLQTRRPTTPSVRPPRGGRAACFASGIRTAHAARAAAGRFRRLHVRQARDQWQRVARHPSWAVGERLVPVRTVGLACWSSGQPWCGPAAHAYRRWLYYCPRSAWRRACPASPVSMRLPARLRRCGAGAAPLPSRLAAV
jgi:hypothetical protein